MFRYSAIATGSLVLLICGCSTHSGLEKSAALYVAQNEITVTCDRNVTCVDKWAVAQELLRKNSLAKKEGRDIFFGNVTKAFGNLEASLVQNVWESPGDDETSLNK